MRNRRWALSAALALAFLLPAYAQDTGISVAKTIPAGSEFSIRCSGSGSGTLYIVGPAGELKKSVQLGDSTTFPAGSLIHAGHYLATVSSSSGTESTSFDVVPADDPAKLSFLAEPSRLPVDLQNGVAGAVYVFDSFGNLIDHPMAVSFKLSTPSGAPQVHSVETRYGAAWTKMSTTTRDGDDTFDVHAGNVTVSRIVHQVAGDPCQLTMSVHESGQNLQLQTAPVRDCSGNPVPDGTIVTFSETYDGGLSSADVPLKHGIAKVELPAHPGGTLSVASGVVLGNQIRWGK
jgi:hypothetical protein